MVDYGNLADKAKAILGNVNATPRANDDFRAEVNAFFQKVTAHIGDEMVKANLELRKRGVGTISRNHLPSFEGVIFLTLGTKSLCRVEVESKKGISQITASISGPPNGSVISQKEYILGQEASGLDARHAPEASFPHIGVRPEQIAEDIISGIIVGNFD
jgi:hypothetical protein